MKKIIFVITKGNWGGAQKYVFDLATSLPKNQFDVAVACGTSVENGTVLPEKLRATGVPVITLPRLGRNINVSADILVFFDLIRMFRAERPDMVHLNSSKIGGLGALAARLAGIKKIVFTVHGLPANENRPWIQKKTIAFLSWLTILFATDVIFISGREQKQVMRWPGVRQKSNLIYNALRPGNTLSRIEARKTLEKNVPGLELDGWKTIVGTIAEMTPNKGLDFGLAAVAGLPECLWIIIGRGELEKKFRAKIQARDLEKQVILAGFLTDAGSLISGFDIFLLPSTKEGLPYVILEAGMAGAAVVASDVGSIGEIITTGHSGILVPPQQSEEIAKALRTLIEKPDSARSYGDNLQKTVREKFNFQKMIGETIRVYEH